MRGRQNVPSFYGEILEITYENIRSLVEKELEGGPLFIVDLKIGPGNAIELLMDGDRGFAIHDCVRVSRLIEGNLDREVQDFSLSVSSAGLDRSISLPRQFRKNIGRTLKLKLKEEIELNGKLTKVDQDTITLYVEKNEKVDGKKKLIKEDIELKLESIIEAKVVISFK